MDSSMAACICPAIGYVYDCPEHGIPPYWHVGSAVVSASSRGTSATPTIGYSSQVRRECMTRRVPGLASRRMSKAEFSHTYLHARTQYTLQTPHDYGYCGCCCGCGFPLAHASVLKQEAA